MKCYFLANDEMFDSSKTLKLDVTPELEEEIMGIIRNWRVRNLKQYNGNSLYAYDDPESETLYEALYEDGFVIKNGKIFAYYGRHFDETCYVLFDSSKSKIRFCSYDYSDYSNGTGRIDRGFVDIVRYPDTDNNPYADQPRFHSQEEYDDYIKWRD